MRLIDADALIESMGLENAVKWGNKDGYQQKHSYSTMMLYEIKDSIDYQPTIDTAPVKHGRWMEQHVDYASDCAIDEIQDLKCSVCGLYHTTPYVYNITHYKFCPNCGAKMDLEG